MASLSSCTCMVSTISSRRLLAFAGKARSLLVRRTCGGIEYSPVMVYAAADISVCFGPWQLRVIRLCSVEFLEGSVMTTEASLDKVYAEVKRVRVKLESIEKTLESLKESMIPEEKVSPEEVKELKALKREALRGECVPLAELLKKHGAKRRAVDSKRQKRSA